MQNKIIELLYKIPNNILYLQFQFLDQDKDILISEIYSDIFSKQKNIILNKKA